MPDHFNTDDEIIDFVSRKAMGGSALSAAQQADAKEAARLARHKIEAELVYRWGDTERAVAAWRRGKDCEKHLALYFFLTDSSAREEYNQDILDRIRKDWLEPLETGAVQDTGDPPAPSAAGQVTHGAMSGTGYTFDPAARWY